VTASIFLAGKESIHEPKTARGAEGEAAGLLQISGRCVRLRSGIRPRPRSALEHGGLMRLRRAGCCDPAAPARLPN